MATYIADDDYDCLLVLIALIGRRPGTLIDQLT
ncbi:hypothetical protein CCACVL1_14570, partial [Corchorus capsularis]